MKRKRKGKTEEEEEEEEEGEKIKGLPWETVCSPGTGEWKGRRTSRT
jgi:hypothetical protein